jgi:hypothetical protein
MPGKTKREIQKSLITQGIVIDFSLSKKIEIILRLRSLKNLILFLTME